MRRRTAFALILCATTSLSCENFDLKAKPDAGSGAVAIVDGAVSDAPNVQPVASGVIPAGALLGEKKTLFGGDCQTWAIVDSSGKIVEFSWSLPMATINGIPASTVNDVINFVDLPQVVKDQTIFRSIDFSFLPHGHSPPGVYDVPHWEFHVSHFTQAERLAIDCADQTQPTADYIAPNWIVFPGCLLTQGQHAYDLTAPEFNKERFTKGNYATYYHGFVGGIEPQATRDLLVQTRADIDFLPSMVVKKYGITGLYPAKVHVHWIEKDETYVWTASNWSMVN
jgi:hypothetical protein